MRTDAGQGQNSMESHVTGNVGPSRAENLYTRHYAFLCGLIVTKFGVAQQDAAALVHDVFVSFLERHETIENERSWLIGAACNRARLYWRGRGRDGTLPAVGYDIGDDDATAKYLEHRVQVGMLLQGSSPRCRHLLHLRFFEGYSPEEIAAMCGTTVPYAKKLVHNCVAALKKRST
jgi:RNA polymerase sigma factor (sigma-70 family)